MLCPDVTGNEACHSGARRATHGHRQCVFRRHTYGAVSGADRVDAPHTTGLTAYKAGVDTGCVCRSRDDLHRRGALFDALHGVYVRYLGGKQHKEHCVAQRTRGESAGKDRALLCGTAEAWEAGKPSPLRCGRRASGLCQSPALQRLRAGDGLLLYSPRFSSPDGEPCQRFTALGVVTTGEVYRQAMGEGFVPYRLDITSLPCHEVPIQPLIAQLSCIKDKARWGAAFRFGSLRVPAQISPSLRSRWGVMSSRRSPQQHLRRPEAWC
jgi:hypothetical protein